MERPANVHQINLNSSKGLLSPFVCELRYCNFIVLFKVKSD